MRSKATRNTPRIGFSLVISCDDADQSRPEKQDAQGDAERTDGQDPELRGSAPDPAIGKCCRNDAVKGPIALATSLAPWAKDKSAAAQISGRGKACAAIGFRFSRPAPAGAPPASPQARPKVRRDDADCKRGRQRDRRDPVQPFDADIGGEGRRHDGDENGTHRIAEAILSSR